MKPGIRKENFLFHMNFHKGFKSEIYSLRELSELLLKHLSENLTRLDIFTNLKIWKKFSSEMGLNVEIDLSEDQIDVKVVF